MFKKILMAACCLWGNYAANAQKLPKVHLTAGNAIGETTPYKLVFYDDFDGTAIDPTKWNTFAAYSGMSPHDHSISCEHDQWSNGRISNDFKSAIRDENVIVNGGICHLMFYNEALTVFSPDDQYTTTGTWYRTKFSKGLLQTHIRVYDPATGFCSKGIGFNSGRFEAKLKMPVYNHGHSSCWLFDTNEVNELDLVEAYGGPKMAIGTRRYGTYGIHVWWKHPDPVPAIPPLQNPYHLDYDYDGSQSIPHQKIIDWIKGSYMDMNDWHTYVCEWDSSVIRFYLDGAALVPAYKYYFDSTYYKWEQRIDYNAGGSFTYYVHQPYKIHCVADGTVKYSGNYNIFEGFPWKPDSWNVLDIDPDVTNDESYAWNPAAKTLLGELDVDHVKIWQRNPAADNHIDICAQNVPKIIGPDIVCSNAAFTTDIVVPGATFTAKPMGPLGTVSSTPSSLSVSKNSMVYPVWSVSYTYSKAGCPVQSVIKKVDVGPPTQPYQACTKTTSTAGIQYYLSAIHPLYTAFEDYHSATTFEWTVTYGASRTYHAFGRYISTPPIPSSEASSVSWTLKVTNACGNSTFTGSKAARWLKVTQDSTNTDTMTHFFNANITDTAAYEQAVHKRVSLEPIIDLADTIAIEDMIERIRFEELDPYILYDTTSLAGGNVADSNSNNNNMRLAPIEAITKVYPNPATHLLNIALGTDFDFNATKTISISNLTGKVVLQQEIQEVKRLLSIDISQLAKDLYVLEIKQNGHAERFKFMKQ
jgi:hypothetical protein